MAEWKTKRAGLVLPVARIHATLKRTKPPHIKAVSITAAVHAAAICEYVMTEIFHLATEVALKHNRKRVLPRDMVAAVRADPELSKLFSGVCLASDGTLSNVTKMTQCEFDRKRALKAAELKAHAAAA